METVFNEDFLIMSDQYDQAMTETVLPWLKQKERESFLSTFDGHPLFCVTYDAEDPVGTVLIIHGFTENAYKYSELIYSLLHMHFSVVAYDQRGHGRSWRAKTQPDSSVTHVDRFMDYVSDLKTIYDSLIQEMPRPFMVFAHSMGGAVASLFLEQYPDAFVSAVLSSPMIAPQTAGVPGRLASAMASVAILMGKSRNKPFFMKAYSGPEDFETSCATDPKRFFWYDRIKASRKEFQNSVPTYQWSRESIRVKRFILSPGRPERINCPVLLFSAENDFSVKNDAQRQFIHRVREGRLVSVPDARHEIYRSVNAVLFPWWHQVLSFYKAQI